MSKDETLIIRLDKRSHNIIKIKSLLAGKNKSDFIRNATFSFWHGGREKFKEILELYKKATTDEKTLLIDMLFEYYRREGFPYPKMSEDEKITTMNNLSITKIKDEENLPQNTYGITLPNFFHTHLYSVKYGNSKTACPMGYFQSDDKLKDCINRCMELGKIPDPTGMRRMLKSRDGVRCVVNFKPAISKFIYDNYVPENGKILDPCSGYSGRLVGCISTKKNISYTGIDPDSLTAIGNMKCAAFFNKQYDVFGNRLFPFIFNFHLGCAEDVMPRLGVGYDLVFTSPPYMNVELYSDNPEQSYLKYPNYNDWMSKFLFVIVNESWRILKTGGYLALNVKNYKKHPIADDLIKYCAKIGFSLKKTYQMKMANKEFHLKEGNSFHSEPIFVWQKP